MNAKKQSYSGAELREQAERFAAQLDPTAEAERHERSFLGAMGTAKEHFDWLVEHQAWTLLGHATFADWWDERVVPVAAGLGMRPTREIARTVVEIVASEQKTLPRDQRKSQKQIAAMVGLGVGTVNRQLNPAAEPPNGMPHSVPNGTPEVQADPLSLVPEAEQAVNDFIGNQTAAGRANDTPADGDPSTAETSEEAPAAGTGADPLGEADRPVPAVNPEDPPASTEPGTADDAPTSSAATPPAAGAGPAQGDETEPEESAFPASPGTVDGQEQQDLAGVSGPAAPGPDKPEELLEWFADRFEEVDVDVSGPLLGSEGLHRIGVALDRVVFVVELLTKWHERTQQ